jgi:hypothetical protein
MTGGAPRHRAATRASGDAQGVIRGLAPARSSASPSPGLSAAHSASVSLLTTINVVISRELRKARHEQAKVAAELVATAEGSD